MAMVVKNNIAAALALQETDKNTNKLSKDLQKASSGLKINGAGDGASEYAISEGMRSMIRALNQDIANTRTGRDIVKVAEGGIQSIIEELRTLKELAINSANDHNGKIDRATLQREFDQRMANIEDIAEGTTYNGKLLLNGTYRRVLEGIGETSLGNIISSNKVTTVNTTTPVTTSSTSTSVRTSSPVSNTTRSTTTSTSATMPTTGTTEGTPVTTTNTVGTTSIIGPTTNSISNTVSNSDITEEADTITEVRRDVTTTNVTNTTVETVTDTTTITTTKISTIVSAEEVTGTGADNARMITKGMTTITESGVWKFADDYTGSLAISADNVTILGANNTLSDVYITDSSNNLYLKNVNISNMQDKSAIAFTGNTGTLHVIGDNSIKEMLTGGVSTSAVINSQEDVYIVGSGTLNIARNDSLSTGAVSYSGAIIGGNSGQVCGSISIGSGVTLEINETWSRASIDYGAAIGTGLDGTCGDITIGSGATVKIVRNNGNPSVSDYRLYGEFYGPGIGSANGGKSGDIYLLSDANIKISQVGDHQSTCIGAGRSNSICGDITLYTDLQFNLYDRWNRHVYPETDEVVLGAGPENCSCGDIIYCKGAGGSMTLEPSGTQGAFYGARGTNSHGTISYKVKSEKRYSNDTDTVDPSTMPTTTYNITTETITNITASTTVSETKTTTYETYTETREDITTTVYKKDKSEVVKLNIPLIIHTGPKANEELRVYIEDMGPEALGIKEVKIDPREAAVKALGQIDKAIDYALEQATQMGAYGSRLEQTEENLVTASANTQSSESTIRDADMAKSMMEYTKDSILAQASQAMLAQANQNGGSVLNLLE